jgi:hypothetical protein
MSIGFFGVLQRHTGDPELPARTASEIPRNGMFAAPAFEYRFLLVRVPGEDALFDVRASLQGLGDSEFFE